MKLSSTNKYSKIAAVALASMIGLALPAFADVIDFESLTGPGVFASASPVPQTVVLDNTTFTGGVILTNTTNLPADETSVYGSASFVPGMSNPITITNPNGFNNIFFDLLNGQVAPTSYLITDNDGHSAEFDNVPSNTNTGAALVGFASTGTEITIQDISSTGSWDFFIDNVTFDEPLPPSLAVPEVSSTALLLLGGLLCLAVFGSRRRATA
ncbi:MAG: hypothetical protein ABSE59_06070 [Opitutaceae bacterium]|jgi:hypothetical protein